MYVLDLVMGFILGVSFSLFMHVCKNKESIMNVDYFISPYIYVDHVLVTRM